MSEPSDAERERSVLRDQIIGLGAKSLRKSYYPQLQKQIEELEEAKAALEEKSASLLHTLMDLEMARQRAEQSEWKFRMLFEKISDGVVLGNLDRFHMVMVNPAYCKMMGCTEEEALALTMADVHPPEEFPRIQGLLASLKENETAALKDLAYKRKDGKIIYFDVNSNVVEIANEKYALAVCRDITERKLAEQALIREKEFSRALVENITSAVVACNASLEITVRNRSARDWYGEDVPNAPAEKWAGLYGMYSADGVTPMNPADMPLYRAAVYGETLRDIPLVIRAGGRPMRYVMANSAPFYDGGGRLLGAVLAMHDITMRKLAEDALYGEQVFSNAVLDSVQGLLYLYNEEGVLVRWNKQHEILTGYAPEELSRMHYLDWFRYDPAAEERVARRVEKCMAEGSAEMEAILEFKTGEKKLFHFTAVRLQINGKKYFAGIGIDITERSRVENDLRRLNRLYAVLSQVNQAVVHATSPRELFERVCKVFVELGGFNLVWVGKVDADTSRVMPVASAGAKKDVLEKIRIFADERPEGSGIVGLSIREARTKVSNFFLEEAASVAWLAEAREAATRACISLPIRNAGRVYGALVVDSGEVNVFQDKEINLLEEVAAEVSYALDHLDQEERRQRDEAALMKAKEDAEAANHAKDQFIAVLSHELRTPLTPVLTAATLLQSNEATPREIRSDLDLIRRNVELEAKLIDDLLDVTRISRGLVQLHREVVDAHAALMKTLEICRAEIARKNMKMELNLKAPEHYVWADSARLQQVLWNLVKNAIKFTPPEGTVSIATVNADHRLKIEVADTGIGITSEALPRIFNAFEQGEKTWTRRFGGLGLGLSIAKAIVDLHQGRLTAHSAGPGQGSVFTVELDTATPELSAPTEGAAPKPARGRQWRILLVEDNVDTLRVLSRLLAKWGYYVQGADSVAKALELANREPFDILMSDIGLPDGSGLDIMRSLKAQWGIRGIAISGFGTDDDIRQSRAAGFDEHLTKPVGIEGLRQAIDRVAPGDG